VKTRTLLLLGLVPATLAGGFLLLRRRQAPVAPLEPAKAPQLTAPQPQPVAPTPPAPIGAAIVLPQPPPAGVKAGPTGGDILTNLVKGVAGGGAAAIVSAGLKLQEAEAALVAAAGGNQATQDATKLFGHTALIGFGAQQGTKKLLEAVGADANTQKHVSQTVGVGVVAAGIFGAPVLVGVAAGKLAAEGVSALIGLVAGKEAEKDVRNTVSQLDPFKTGSAVNVGIKAVADVIFGPSTPPPPPKPVVAADPNADKGAGQVKNDADRAAAAAVAARAQSAKQGTGGIVNRRLIQDDV
jgi:hypothetical protein